MTANADVDENEEGIEPDAWLARPRFTPALGAVVQRLLRAADRLYARSDAGIEGLPADWYLRLTGEGTKVIRGERPAQAALPIRP